LRSHRRYDADPGNQNAQVRTKLGGRAPKAQSQSFGRLGDGVHAAVRRCRRHLDQRPAGGGHPMARQINQLWRDTQGVAALEYALIAGLIFAAIIAAGNLYGPQLRTALGNIGQSIVARDAGT
jgi:Flp pilus assembly pilin Flp